MLESQMLWFFILPNPRFSPCVCVQSWNWGCLCSGSCVPLCMVAEHCPVLLWWQEYFTECSGLGRPQLCSQLALGAATPALGCWGFRLKDQVCVISHAGVSVLSTHNWKDKSFSSPVVPGVAQNHSSAHVCPPSVIALLSSDRVAKYSQREQK